jgi:hypothetical protein
MGRKRSIQAMGLLLGVLAVDSCTGPAPPIPAAPASSSIVRDNLTLGGQASVSIRIGDPALRTQANPAYTAADVAKVDLYLYTYNATPDYDYVGSGSLQHSVLTYSWSGGADGSGNNRFTFNNVPFGSYVVVGRAKDAGGGNITKTASSHDWAVTTNYVTIAAGTTTYSSGSNLTLTIPLQDAVGAAADTSTTFLPGGAPTATGADGKPLGYAPDDAGDPTQIHDHTVNKSGVDSTFVWIPRFMAWQLINPSACGATMRHGTADNARPTGWWVDGQPSAGISGIDWAPATFGGFYAGKYEASRADATGSAAGASATLSVRSGVVPWGNLELGTAIMTCQQYDADAHLMTAEEWAALGVWATARGVRIYGNNDGARKDADDANVTFTADPTVGGRALTGTGTNVGWSGGINLTTHTGTTAGVYDLNGNVAEMITGLSVTTASGLQWLVKGILNPAIGHASSVLGAVTRLATDPVSRRLLLPDGVTTTGGPYDGDGFSNLPGLILSRGGSWQGGAYAHGSGAGIFNVDQMAAMGTFLGFRPALAFLPHKILMSLGTPKQHIYAFDPDGSNAIQLTSGASNNWEHAWSPDRTRVVFTSDRDGNNEIYVMNSDGSGQTRLTSNAVIDRHPAWSPDGTKIAFSSNRDGNNEIYVMNADGTAVTRITNNSTSEMYPSWSPDGTKIAFVSNQSGNDEIFTMLANGSSWYQETVNTFSDTVPSWSHDGTRIAFKSNRDGNTEIYVKVNPRTINSQTRLTNHAADDKNPKWSPDDTKIIFSSDRSGIYRGWQMNSADGTGLTQISAYNYAHDLDWR